MPLPIDVLHLALQTNDDGSVVVLLKSGDATVAHSRAYTDEDSPTGAGLNRSDPELINVLAADWLGGKVSAN